MFLLVPLLFCLYTLMFATRGVNLGLVQVSLTSAIIILINIFYPGQWQLAETRIPDVVIGGAIAIETVYLLGISTAFRNIRTRGGRA